MKKQTRKWATALLAVSCASICIGAGVAAHTYSATDVTAEAENPYNLHEIGALTVHVNSSIGAAHTLNDQLYLKRADGQALPILSWDYAFAAENENCFKVNGKPAALEVMKSTPDGMYFKFSALNPGDVVTISGTYVCDSQATSYAITESSFKWGGSGWSDYVYIEYEEFNVGSLDYSHGNAKQVYFKPTNSEIVLPINNWSDAFSYGSGNGITVDGEMISMVNSVKSPEGVFFADLGKNASVGSVLKIGGTLNCDKQQIAYIIEDCEFIWNGETWVKQGVEIPDAPESSDSSENIESSETPIEYTTYNVNVLDGANNCSATAVYAWVVEGDALNINSWDHAFTFEEGSGAGMLLNGVALAGWDMKQPGADLYIGLGTTADTGAVLTIDGAFYNEAKAAKIVFNNCQLQFNGTTWVTYGETPEIPDDSESSEDIESSETPIEYETYTINAIKAESTSSATAVYLIPADGDGRTLGAGDWDNIYTLEAGSGEGLKLNGVALTTTDIKQPGSFFIGLGVTAVAGDVLTIDGAYYNNQLAKKIIFNNCEIEFDGAVWGAEIETPDTPDVPDSSEDIESSETPVEPTTYTINKLDGANNCSATAVFAWVVEGDQLGVSSWDHAFGLEDGDGLYLNDQMLIGWEIKQPGADLYIALGETAVAGDVLTINGTFYNEAKAATLIFNNCKLQFNGTTWETYREPVVYTYYELGQMIINAGSSTNSAIYIARADGGELPVHSWDYEFKFVYDSGCGLVFNGEAFTTKDVKSPGNEVYIGLGEHTAKEGDVMTVGGTFCNDDSAVAYVIEESTFVYMNN
ncbi:MAG: hypothetical protein IIX02_04710, partial [Clostridia bacterium]|nr:hypothetical protein [Clostridia bacterium]